jgi:hypothetical protein
MSSEQIFTSKAQPEKEFKLIQKPDLNKHLLQKYREQIELSSHFGAVVNESIHRGINGLGDFGIDKSKFTPEIIATLKDLHSRGLSKANPDLEFEGYYDQNTQDNFIIQKPCDLEISCPYTGETIKGGPKILEMLKLKLPTMLDRKAFVIQGSASKPCPKGYDIEIGAEIARENKIMISGGTGIENSVMERTAKGNLDNSEEAKKQGVLICLTLPSLMDTSVKHFEKPFFTDGEHKVLPEYEGRVISLVTPNLPQRLALFQYIATQGRSNNGEIGFKTGGPGTADEGYKTILQQVACPELGSYSKIHLSKTGLWNNYFAHLSKIFNIKI